MRFNKAVLSMFGNKTAVKILEKLVSSSGMFSGRALARMAGVNHQACLNAVKKLRSLGVLKDAGTGRNLMYSLDKNNILVKELVMPVFSAQERIDNSLSRDLQNLKNRDIVSIILFGSVAKRTDDEKSDIDILAVVKDGVDKEEVADDIHLNETDFVKKYGNTLSPAIMTESEFRAGFKKKNSLVVEVVKTGRVAAGKSMGELIEK